MNTQLLSNRENGEFQAGDDLVLTATVKNDGKEALYQVRGQSSSPYSRFDDIEWIFGTVLPGESRSWTVTIPLPRNAMARTTPIDLQFYSDETLLEGLKTRTQLQIKPLKKVIYISRIQLISLNFFSFN